MPARNFMDPSSLARRLIRHALVAPAIATLMVLLLPALAAATLTFDLPLPYATGPTPRALLLADVNRDGLPDLVVGHGGAPSFSTLLATTAGGFGPRQDWALEGVAGGLASADLDGDGILDIVAALPAWNFVNMLLGTTGSGFTNRVRHYTGTYSTAVAIAEINGQIGLDFAVAQVEHGAVDVFYNNGTGVMSIAARFPVGADPRCVVAGDLDGDGRDDLVTANAGANTVAVLRSTGTGSFAPRLAYPAPTTPVAVVLADLDGDTNLDVVVASSGADSIAIYAGVGDGTLGPRVDLATGDRPTGIAVADVDSDGLPDLVVANSGETSVSVFLALAGGGYAERVDLPAGGGPVSVAVRDLDGDGRQDIVCTNSTENTVTVLLQKPQRIATSLTLSCTPNPSEYGQEILLSTDVTPAETEGDVQFSAGPVVLGTVPLTGGHAEWRIPSLGHGEYAMRARYMGNATHASSLSPIVPQLVGLSRSTTSVTSSENPAYWSVPVIWTATVEALAPEIGTPGGKVQFKVDGANVGTPVTLVNGSASLSNASLTIGTHEVQAVYAPADTFTFAASASPVLAQVVVSSNPEIVEVRDVPNDQGGLVFLTWRCPLDQPPARIVTGYRVWRRVPAALAPATSPRDGWMRTARADSLGEDFWEAIASLPSARIVSYGYSAPTTQDSLAGANPMTAFFVQALTSDAYVWYSSAPDSGYSVDNLAPPPPAQFVAQYSGTGTALHWIPSRASDLSHYGLYRGSSSEFVPGPANRISASPDTGYFDPDGTGEYCYKLAAVDIHGNIGRFAVVTPLQPTAAVASLVSAEIDGERALLRWYVSIDDAVVLSIERRRLDGGWTMLGEVGQDGEGMVTFEDSDLAPGVRFGWRLAMRFPDGSRATAGEAWLDVPLGEADLALRITNPALSGSVDVSFAAPAGPPVRIDLFDLAGRVVATRFVSGGLGRQSVRLAGAGALVPGIYLVRVGLPNAVTRRVAVVR